MIPHFREARTVLLSTPGIPSSRTLVSSASNARLDSSAPFRSVSSPCHDETSRLSGLDITCRHGHPRGRELMDVILIRDARIVSFQSPYLGVRDPKGYVCHICRTAERS